MRAVRVLVMLMIATSVASAGPTRSQWKAADKTLRDHLAAAKTEVIDVSPRKRMALGTAFWVRASVDGQQVGKLYVVRGAKVYDTKGNATVSEILAADKQLEKRKIAARDLLYLITELGDGLPAGFDTVTMIRESDDKRVNPKLALTKHGGTLVIHTARDVHIPEAPAHPKLYYTRATLTIAADYSLSWQVEDVELPDHR